MAGEAAVVTARTAGHMAEAARARTETTTTTPAGMITTPGMAAAMETRAADTIQVR